MEDRRNVFRQFKALKSREERRQYFWDYMLWPTVAVIAAVGLAIFLIVKIVTPADHHVLYVAVFDEDLNEVETDILKNSLQEQFGADGKHETVLIDDNFVSTNDEDMSRFNVLTANHEIDVVIADEDVFKALAAYGYMTDLDTVLSEDQKSQWSSELVYSNGLGEDDTVSLEDTESGKGPVEAYGLSLSNSTEYSKIGNLLKTPVMGVVLDDTNQTNAISFAGVMLEGAN